METFVDEKIFGIASKQGLEVGYIYICVCVCLNIVYLYIYIYIHINLIYQWSMRDV